MWIHLLTLGLIDGAGGVAPPVATAQSGVARMWLIEYYTREFAKNEERRKTPENVTPAEKRKVTIAAKAKRKREVAELVDKAEKQLDSLTQGIKDAEAAQIFIFQLLQFSQQIEIPAAEIDFVVVANDYRKALQREDEELLLLSMVI